MYDAQHSQYPAPHGSPYAAPHAAPHGGPTVPVYGPELASWGSRAVASLIDSVLALLLFYGTLLLGLGASTGLEMLFNPDRRYGDPSWFAALTIGVFFVAAFVLMVRYWYIPVAKTGKTVGKRLLGIKIVALATGEPPSKGRALGRYGAMVLFSLVWLVSLLDVLWPLWDQPYRQSLHDKMAATYVIRG